MISGFKHGFSLKYNRPRTGCIHPNLKSAHQFQQLLQKRIDKERSLGIILGPFKKKPFENLIYSPVGMVPKKNWEEMRMITHLSFPHRDSINSHMDPQDTKTQYQSFDCALHLVAKMGKAAYMSKGDVKSAFRIIPIRKQDWHLLGIKINDNFYIDICLPFGASISCAIFEQAGNLLQWLAKCRAGHDIVCYLNDFFTLHQIQYV